MTVKQGLKLSAIIDKLGINISDPKAGAEKVGADLLMQVVTKAHKAENEIYSFISEIKKIDIKQAEEVDLIEFIKSLINDTGAMSFFKSVVKSKDLA